jgi:hypothetical protein
MRRFTASDTPKAMRRACLHYRVVSGWSEGPPPGYFITWSNPFGVAITAMSRYFPGTLSIPIASS